MRLNEILQVPRGKFRVFGRDNFEEEFFLVDDYESQDEAMGVARCKEKDEERVNGRNNEIAATFYVIDTKLNFLYGLLDLTK